MNVSVVDNNFPTFYDGWVRDGETHCIISWVLSRDSVRGNKPVILLLPFPPILCLFPRYWYISICVIGLRELSGSLSFFLWHIVDRFRKWERKKKVRHFVRSPAKRQGVKIDLTYSTELLMTLSMQRGTPTYILLITDKD